MEALRSTSTTFASGLAIASGTPWYGKLVKAGPAVVAVRIFDYFGDGGLVGRPEHMWLSPAEGTKPR